MQRRLVWVIADTAGSLQIVEDAVDHVQPGSQNKVSRHQFHRRPFVALSETDEPVKRDVDAALLDAGLDGFGDGHTAALGARRLVGLETAVDADQDFVRAGVHMFYLSTAARGTELIAMLGEYTGISTDWRLQKARPYLAIFHNILILFRV